MQRADAEPWVENRRQWQREFKTGQPVVVSRPSWLMIDTASVCNLRCVQCPRENPTQPFTERIMSPEMAEAMLSYLPYLSRLTLRGLGEPFLSEMFWRIVEDDRCKEIPLLEISTNGTLLSERNVDRVLRSYLNFMHISIDAAFPQTYQRIRRGNLDKVVAGIRRLTTRRKELGRDKLKIWLGVTLMMENIRELPAIVELAADMGVDAVDAWHMTMRSDEKYDRWVIEHGSWTFDKAQHLENAPTLSNQMVRRAIALAEKIGIPFHHMPAIWLPE